MLFLNALGETFFLAFPGFFGLPAILGIHGLQLHHGLCLHVVVFLPCLFLGPKSHLLMKNSSCIRFRVPSNPVGPHFFIKIFFYVDHYFKSLLNLLQYFFCCLCPGFWLWGCGIFAPQPGMKPSAPHWKAKCQWLDHQGSPQYGLSLIYYICKDTISK